MFSGAWFVPQQLARLILIGSAAGMLLLALMFKTLTVRDEGDSLRIQFGPLPIFGRSILFANIDSVEQGRTSILDGFGIHLNRGGWVWNLWGFDCVELTLKKGRRMRIGTDDPTGLVAFLKEFVSQGHRKESG